MCICFRTAQFVLALIVVMSPATPANSEAPTHVDLGGERFKNLSEIKKQHPFAKEWISHKYNGMSFIFCKDVLPSDGRSFIDLHGWFYNSHAKAWESFLTFRTQAVYGAEIVFDDTKGHGTLRGNGDASTEFKGKDLIIFSLRVIEPEG